MTFCRDCQAAIEWHKTAEGRNVPIDPLPRPDGDFMFDAALRVVRAPLDLRRAVREANARGEVHKKKLYKVHLDTCTKRRAPAAFICERRGCTVQGRHLHCFECGETDHLAEACPDGG